MTINLLLSVINALSLLIIGGLTYVLKGLISDVKQLRHELDVLSTEHRVCVHCKVQKEV